MRQDEAVRNTKYLAATMLRRRIALQRLLAEMVADGRITTDDYQQILATQSTTLPTVGVDDTVPEAEIEATEIPAPDPTRHVAF